VFEIQYHCEYCWKFYIFYHFIPEKSKETLTLYITLVNIIDILQSNKGSFYIKDPFLCLLN
ncbi:hypothetical protein, partial [Metabacillus fastidiosus]|uniref:hypothetical protein n=1 Tax=Metabacillus fastidiosus TaxID=1458 RepID=UPI002DBF52A7